MIKTNEIYNELKKSVFGQDEYLKQLAITGYKHQLKQELIEEGKKPINSNLLVIGPSGCGKTFSVKLLSKLIDVPFYEINCANLVQVGYKGNQDIDKAFNVMVASLKGKSEKAIVYLDEFDKILDGYLIGEFDDTASQQNFLKYLEPNDLPIVVSSGRTDNTIPISTAGITFIATGSFEGVKRKLKKESSGKMGFNADNIKLDSIQLNEDDLIKGGYIPELIGRFYKLININQLSKEDFVNIVKKGQDSEINTYRTIFDMKNIKLEIPNKVYEEIANKAYNTCTGARNIGKVLNDVLDNCLSDISNDITISSIKIVCDNDELKAEYEHDPSRAEKPVEEVKEEKKTINLNEYRNTVTKYIEDLNLRIRYYNSLRKGFVSLFDEYGEEVEQSAFHETLNNRKRAVNEYLIQTAGNTVDAEELRLELKVYDYLLDKYSDNFVEVKEAI